MDGLRLAQGMPMAAPGMDARSRRARLQPAHVFGAGPRAAGGGTVEAASPAPAPERLSYVFPRPLSMLWAGGGGGGAERVDEELVAAPAAAAEEAGEEGRRRRGDSWVLKILRVKSLWAAEGETDADREVAERAEEGDCCVTCGACDEEQEGCVVGGEEEVGGGVVFDKDSFSRLLRRVTLAELKLYAKMSYLGSLAYTIPSIKSANLLKSHGLRFVTSSLERKARLKAEKEEKEQKAAQDLEQEEEAGKEEEEEEQSRKDVGISPSTAYQIAASAASYLHSQTSTTGILPFKSSDPENEKESSEQQSINDSTAETGSSEVADFMATTNSVTAVVAAKEEMKQAVANDLNSAQNSPCEWYICDDDSSGTRYFVIQGSETLASWQANLLFEPIQFEGLDVLVHRGIYEAAKGIYEQMLPEVQGHLKCRGNSATLRFTGHSLGGSLSLLVNLMLLIRGEAPPSSLLPVITFGAPTIMCGGDYLLRKLGLPQSHVQAITMHRDIVPRAFSCNYPDHVARILKAINGNFRNHPCLENQKLLYAPMGRFLILQPEEKYSPHHHLLPPGSGLYLLGRSSPESSDSVRLLEAAQSAFLNSPHPLEILSDRSAYGSEGAVYRDHDMNAYLRSMQGVIKQELKQISRKAEREKRRQAWWPLVAPPGIHIGMVTCEQDRPSNSTSNHHFSFSGVLHGGKETLKQLGKLVGSQDMHMFVLLLFPARLLLLGTLAVVNFSSI